jgi:hypothetical protein
MTKSAIITPPTPSYPLTVVKDWTRDVWARLGYKISSSNCGMVDMRDLSFVLQADFDDEAPNVDLDLD